MEVVDVLHVAEDDVLLAGDARRNLLHTVGHLPQVRLRNTITVSDLQELHFESAQRPEGVSPHLQTLLEVSDVGLLRLQQLCHDEPEARRHGMDHCGWTEKK